MALYFITGSARKAEEIKAVIPDIKQLDIELQEIQELDPHTILASKLLEARKHYGNAYIVEDTSLYIDGMNGLPGPLIKWFLNSVGCAGLFGLTKIFGTAATAKTLIGYVDEKGGVEFFDGEVRGTIVEPREPSGFGWDAIFIPEGHNKTFGEMGFEEKNSISMRRRAAEKLKEHLGK